MSHSYEEDLWDGTKIVFDRYDEGKRIVKEMIEFLKERVSVEESYAKGLTKSIKSGNLELKGTLPSNWQGMKAQVEQTAKQHSTFAVQLQQNLLTPLMNQKADQSKVKIVYESEIGKLNKDLEKSRATLNKAKMKYHKEAKELETVSGTLDKNPPENPKELTKLKTKAVNLQKSVEQLDAAYKSSVADHQQMQKKYEEEMKKYLNLFQSLEEKRGEFVKETFEKFILFQEALHSGLQQSVLTFQQQFAHFDPLADMQNFLEEKSTGLAPPPLVEYEPFSSSIPPSRISRGPSFEVLDDHKKEEETPSPVPSPSVNPNRTGTVSTPVESTPETSKPTHPTSVSTNLGNSGPSPTTAPQTVQPTPPTAQEVIQQQMEKKLPRDRLSALKIGITKPATTRLKKAKATFDYEPEEDNELGFTEGSIITVLRMDESGWWEGELNGTVGIFPGNYVKLLSKEEADEKQRKCKVMFDFTADTDDELTIVENEIVTIESEAEGWILGTNQKGEQGLFPANYVEEIK